LTVKPFLQQIDSNPSPAIIFLGAALLAAFSSQGSAQYLLS